MEFGTVDHAVAILVEFRQVFAGIRDFICRQRSVAVDVEGGEQRRYHFGWWTLAIALGWRGAILGHQGWYSDE